MNTNNNNKSLDPFDISREIEKILLFYKTCFKDEKWKNPDLENFDVPISDIKMGRLDFIPPGMTIRDAYDAYFGFFGKEKILEHWIVEDSSKRGLAGLLFVARLDESTIPKRPNGYFYLHTGAKEPDIPYSDEKMPSNFDINCTMTPLESIISDFRYRFENGYSYDNNLTVTVVAALTKDEVVLTRKKIMDLKKLGMPRRLEVIKTREVKPHTIVKTPMVVFLLGIMEPWFRQTELIQYAGPIPNMSPQRNFPYEKITKKMGYRQIVIL